MLDNEEERRSNLTQLNRGEGRHSMARAVSSDSVTFKGHEDQLGALGLVLNMIVLWNIIYMQPSRSYKKRATRYDRRTRSACLRWVTTTLISRVASP